MRFLIVLALIKCAATYSVSGDPWYGHGGHNSVSVPIGNGMNVDIDVTVDINTGADDKECVQGWEEPCKTTSDCCDHPMGFDLTCRETSYGKRCVTDEKCYAAGEKCWPKWFNCCPGFSCQGPDPQAPETFKCQENHKDGTDEPTGPRPCVTKGPCGGLEYHCCKGYKCKWSKWGSYCHKKSGTDENCTPSGQPCKTSSECCEYQTQTMTCKESGLGDKRCMPSKDQKCNANEGERCTSDEDCCEKDNTCEAEVAGIRQYCTYNPKDCIEDGEPCHGTDDWTHECCSKSCCEGKCGTCGYTPWFKRF